MIGLIGINYKTAPVDVREKFSFSNDEVLRLIELIKENESVNGAVLVSTCNRTELYLDIMCTVDAIFPFIHKLICSFKDVDCDKKYFYTKEEHDTISHLFHLGAGLESMVIGETQILGQLKDSYRVCTENNLTTTLLSRLFHRTFETAKKVRSMHKVDSVPRSAGASAVAFISKKLGKDEKPLIIGAGLMAETVVEALKNIGYNNVAVYNRTFERAEKFANKHKIEFFSGDQLEEAIASSTFMFVATSALTPIVIPEIIRERTSNLAIFDLAVPRNVETSVNDLPFVSSFSIDELSAESSEIDDIQKEKMKEAKECINEMVSLFETWKASLPLKEVFGKLESTFDDILERRLSFVENKISKDEFSLVETNCRYMKKKFSSTIIHALRAATEEEKNIKYAEMVNRLLTLNESK